MAVYSTNQARQLYVVNSVLDSAPTTTPAVGSAFVGGGSGHSAYIIYGGVDGMERSDLIDPNKIISAKATRYDALARKLKKFEVTLSADVNSGAPVAGQEYLLRITFRNWIGLSPQYTYDKYGVVGATTGMTASDFYKTLALSLVLNFKRELTPLLNFSLKTESGSTPVTPETKKEDLTGPYVGLIIEEVNQPWVLGRIDNADGLSFQIFPDTIQVNGLEQIWGTVEDQTSSNGANAVPDGTKIADLEYFCMGERGDTYRNIGFPRVIATKYLVDPSKVYNVIDVHYYYSGSNESVQKSEKTMTFVVPADGATGAAQIGLANKLIGKLNTAFGATAGDKGYIAPLVATGLPTGD